MKFPLKRKLTKVLFNTKRTNGLYHTLMSTFIIITKRINEINLKLLIDVL